MPRGRIGRCKASFVRSFFLFLLLVVVPEPVRAFLGRGTLLETEGDIFGIYCPEFDRGTQVWHHRDITREAVRRVIDRYFQEVAPAVGKYNHRPDMSLEQAYAEYYGVAYSPKPFLDAVATLVDAVAEADTGLLGADPRYHFGNERFSESQENLNSRWRRIFRAGQAGDYSAALYLLGLSLSTIQDFYSNTNWIELGNTDYNHDVGITGKNLTNVAGFQEGTCKDCPDAADGVGSCPNNLLQKILDGKKLTSGYNEDAYVDGVRIGKPTGVNKCSHGGPRDRSHWTGARGGINKELPTACFSPHHHLHNQAAELAVQASEHYLNLLRGGIGDALFSRLLGLHPTPALVIVLDTTDSMDEELAALTHSVNRLVRQHASATYPPAEYILVPFNDPLYGPVTRSQEPQEIYSALTQLRATGGGDEAELSMSALRLALHYAPLHSQAFLFTDASIKDPELFHTVVTLALSKNIKVTPVLTMPVRDGGISGKLRLKEEVLELDENSSTRHGDRDNNNFRLIRSNSSRRQKRQLQSFSKYSELAQRTGGQVIETAGDQTEETSRILESKHYPMAVLWRKAEVNSPQTVRVPVDSLVKELEVSISGQVVSALLVSPKGVNFDLAAQRDFPDYQGYSVVALTPYFIQVRINMTQHQDDLGEWTLTFDPIEVSAAVVSAHTPMDILPAFYTPDDSSNQPSLQRSVGQPSRGLDTYLDIVITGVDTAKLRRVKSAHLVDASGTEVTMDLPVKSPRINTYLSLPSRKLPQGRFTVAIAGEDESGRRFRRESGTVWEMVDSVLAFPFGRDIWGPPGSVLTIPITITNTNTDDDTPSTYFINAYDVFGSTVTLNQTKVVLERNKTVPLKATMEVDPQVLPYTTNTLVVTATSSRGDTSQAQAHISITPRGGDKTAPTCEVRNSGNCNGYLTADTCNSRDWTADVLAEDYGSGILYVKAIPEYDFTNFVSGTPSVTLRYRAKCCSPKVDIQVFDLEGNVGNCYIDIGDIGNAQLKTGEIAGIAVGSILGVVLLILLVVLFVLYRRRHQKENVTPKRARRRSSVE